MPGEWLGGTAPSLPAPEWGHFRLSWVAQANSGLIVVLCMEGVEESATHEVLRPDHARRHDQKQVAETGEAKAGEGGGEDEGLLEPWAETEAVILIGDNDGIHDIGWASANVDHHVNEDMLLARGHAPCSLTLKGPRLRLTLPPPRIWGGPRCG